MSQHSALPAYFTDSLLRQAAGITLYSRGLNLFSSYAVLNLIRIDHTLMAQVEGSAQQPYRVRIKFGPDQLASVDCNCPYDGLWCKHLVAMGLAAIDSPEEVLTIPALEPQLQTLNAADLIALILKLVDDQPELALSLQSRIERLKYSREPVAQNEDHQALDKLRINTRQHLGASSRQRGALIYRAERVLDATPELLDLTFTRISGGVS